MDKIKSNMHRDNKHFVLGLSFIIFSLITSVYWGMIYAEDLISSTSSTISSPTTTTSGTTNTSLTSTTTSTTSGTTTTTENIKPEAPTNLTAMVDGNKVILNWTDNSDNEIGFKIYRGPVWTDIGNVGSNVTSFIDGGRPSGTYTYRLNAFNPTYGYSPISNDVTVTIGGTTSTTTNTSLTSTTTSTTSGTTSGGTTSSGTTTTTENIKPQSPTNLTAIVDGNKVTLNWTDNANNEDKFNIERKLSSVSTWSYLNLIMGSNVTIYKDERVLPGVYYDYRVQACLSGTGCSSYATMQKVFIPIEKIETQVVTNPVTSNTEEEIVKEEVPVAIHTTSPTLPAVPVSISRERTEIYSGVSTGKERTPSIIEDKKDIFMKETSIDVDNNINDRTNEISKVIFRDKIKIPEKEISVLINKDTNKDGVSDYDSKYIYNIDPVKPSPVSTYEGRNVTAGEKILLGFDPKKKELEKVIVEEPTALEKPEIVVSSYKVNEVKLTETKRIELKGVALPNSFITIYIYSTPIMVTIKTDSKGEWKYTLDKELENGDHTVYTATVNNTGNIIAKSSPYTFTKTAEAVTTLDAPVLNTPNAIEKPGLVNGKNIFIIIIGLFMSIGITLIIIGLFTKNNKYSLNN